RVADQDRGLDVPGEELPRRQEREEEVARQRRCDHAGADRRDDRVGPGGQQQGRRGDDEYVAEDEEESLASAAEGAPAARLDHGDGWLPSNRSASAKRLDPAWAMRGKRVTFVAAAGSSGGAGTPASRPGPSCAKEVAMAVTVKRISLWRADVENQPGVL